MASKLEKLQFAVGVSGASAASSKLGKVQKSLSALMEKTKAGLAGMGMGALGLWGMGAAVKAAVSPAIDLNRALTRVGTTGVEAQGLKDLQQAAGGFAMSYGGSALDIIATSEKMQKSIGGLSGKQLAVYATASGVLAKAGTDTLDTTSTFLAGMHKVFAQEAAAMGQARWAEKAAGQAHAASKLFHRSIEDFHQGFTGLGQAATKAGVGMAEQYAVLGSLQIGGVDSGASGKMYADFIAGAHKAKKALGVAFTDNTGALLGMEDILEQVRGKYGDVLTAQQQASFSDALGAKELGPFLNVLLGKQGQLGDTLKKLQGVSDLSAAKAGARQSTDAFQRFGGAVDYLKTAFWQKLLPTLERWTDKVTENITLLGVWADKYPNVTRVLGYAALALMALAGVAALASLGFYVWKLASMGVMGPLKGVTAAMKLFNMVALANPITLVVLAIAALIGLVVYAIVYWDELTAAFTQGWASAKASLGDTTWGKPIIAIMETIEWYWNKITDLFTDFSWTKLFRTAIAFALKPLEVFIQGLGEILDFAGIEAGAKFKDFTADSFLAEAMPEAVRSSQQAGAARPAQQAEAATMPPMHSSRAATTPPEVQALLTPLQQGQAPTLQSLQSFQGGQKASPPLLKSLEGKAARGGKTIIIQNQTLNFKNPPPSQEDFALMLG